jgi:hypothetical protein
MSPGKKERRESSIRRQYQRLPGTTPVRYTIHKWMITDLEAHSGPLEKVPTPNLFVKNERRDEP